MGEIYLEIIAVETGLRVNAVDAETGIEVVFAAPTRCSRDRINDLARAKLARRIRLEAEASAPAPPSPPNTTKRGRVI